MPDSERDKRTGLQWSNSVIAYCTWRAGECWRKLHVRDQRESAERWQYLDAARLMQSVIHQPDHKFELALPGLHAAQLPDPRIACLQSRPRVWLVRELMAVDSLFTDRELLMRFTRAKLAAMLVRALDSENEAAEVRRA